MSRKDFRPYLATSRTITFDPEQAEVAFLAQVEAMREQESPELEFQQPFDVVLYDFGEEGARLRTWSNAPIVYAIMADSVERVVMVEVDADTKYRGTNPRRIRMFQWWEGGDRDGVDEGLALLRAATEVLLYGCLTLLESANVDVVESERQYGRGHVGEGRIKYEVVVRQTRRFSSDREPAGGARYSHRFEVRGNFAHHFETTASGKENKIFTRWSRERPEKVVLKDGRPCVRIWRPTYVKGPPDRPLIPKIRRVT